METSVRKHHAGLGSNKPHMLGPKNHSFCISQPGERCLSAPGNGRDGAGRLLAPVVQPGTQTAPRPARRAGRVTNGLGGGTSGRARTAQARRCLCLFPEVLYRGQEIQEPRVAAFLPRQAPAMLPAKTPRLIPVGLWLHPKRQGTPKNRGELSPFPQHPPCGWGPPSPAARPRRNASRCSLARAACGERRGERGEDPQAALGVSAQGHAEPPCPALGRHAGLSRPRGPRSQPPFAKLWAAELAGQPSPLCQGRPPDQQLPTASGDTDHSPTSPFVSQQGRGCPYFFEVLLVWERGPQEGTPWGQEEPGCPPTPWFRGHLTTTEDKQPGRVTASP